jgi:hypothetical protein
VLAVAAKAGHISIMRYATTSVAAISTTTTAAIGSTVITAATAL